MFLRKLYSLNSSSCPLLSFRVAEPSIQRSFLGRLVPVEVSESEKKVRNPSSTEHAETIGHMLWRLGRDIGEDKER